MSSGVSGPYGLGMLSGARVQSGRSVGDLEPNHTLTPERMRLGPKLLPQTQGGETIDIGVRRCTL